MKYLLNRKGNIGWILFWALCGTINIHADNILLVAMDFFLLGGNVVMLVGDIAMEIEDEDKKETANGKV